MACSFVVSSFWWLYSRVYPSAVLGGGRDIFQTQRGVYDRAYAAEQTAPSRLALVQCTVYVRLLHPIAIP